MTALDRRLTVTFFTNAFSRSKTEDLFCFASFCRRVRDTGAPQKNLLPWLKLASFGEARSSAGALRNNDNVQTIDGVEADYDGELVGIDEAVAKLRRTGLAAMVYASPSHMVDHPRCGFSARPRERWSL